MKHRKLFSAVLVSSLLLLAGFASLTACSRVIHRKTTIDIMYWGDTEEIAIIEELASMIEKKYPSIKIKLSHSNPGGEYMSKLFSRVAGGNPPDIAFVEVNIWPAFYSKGAFIPLNDFIENDPDFNLTDYFPEVVDRFTVGGQVYVIPRDVAPFAVIYYNKDLFDDAGVKYPRDDWTWSEFIKTAKKLTRSNVEGKIEVYGFYTWAWLNFVYEAGGRLVDSVKHPTRFLLDQPEFFGGVKFYYDLYALYRVSPSPTDLANFGMSVKDMFSSGKLAMYGSGIWETPTFRHIKAFDWDVAPFPKGPGGQWWATGGSGYGILRGTKHPKEAWLVLKELAGDFGQIQLAEKGLAQPAKISIAYSKHWAKSPKKPLHKDFLNWAVKKAIYYPFLENWHEIDARIGLYVSKALNGDMDISRALEEANEEANKLLQEVLK